jgi:hypothetical protein
MAWSEPFHRQVALLLRVLPQVAEEECFALKGGTAINLLVRNMPRLSVDIDLTYLPIKPREASLADIDSAMRRIANRIQSALRGVRLFQPLSSRKRPPLACWWAKTTPKSKSRSRPHCVYAPERLPVTSAVGLTAIGDSCAVVVLFFDPVRNLHGVPIR